MAVRRQIPWDMGWVPLAVVMLVMSIYMGLDHNINWGLWPTSAVLLSALLQRLLVGHGKVWPTALTVTTLLGVIAYVFWKRWDHVSAGPMSTLLTYTAVTRALGGSTTGETASERAEARLRREGGT